jgi:hypothetical protein
MSEEFSNAEIRWLLEEVVIAVSPSPAGAASVDDDEEMANVASNSEELAGNFIKIKVVAMVRWKTEGRDGRFVSLNRGFLYDAHKNIGEAH